MGVPSATHVLDTHVPHTFRTTPLSFPTSRLPKIAARHGARIVWTPILLGAVFKRSLKRCGLQPRRLYAQRHTFLSHALAMGNSPADLAQVAGHSTEMLLKTYAKPTGRVVMPTWG